MSDERRMEVLRAIVQDYVRTSEPVGSKALLESHDLGVSAATVRNDMAALEDAGLIHAPHTSAGRVPTDSGYRLFVDRLGQVKPMSRAERQAISTFLAGAVDLDDVVDRTVRLLAQLTHQVAVMQYPSLARSVVRHVEVVGVGGDRVMIVLILNTGRVEQRLVRAGGDGQGPALRTTASGDAIPESDLADVRTRLNEATQGLLLADAIGSLRKVPESVDPGLRPLTEALVDALAEMLVEEREERVVIAGASNLVGRSTDFPNTVRPVLEALEEHVVLLRLLGNLVSDNDVAVSIGAENTYEPLRSTSVVTAGYGVGQVAVIGPTRMDYPGAMTTLRAVARYVAEMLEQ